MFLGSERPTGEDATSATVSSPSRPYRWRYGPLRLAMPWIVVAAGVMGIIKNIGGLGGVDASASNFYLLGGVGLILLGVASFFVYRWMAKKGI